MLAAVFAFAVVVALVVVVGRRLRQRARRRAWSSQPGYSPEQPLACDRFDAIDQAVRGARCFCGGPLLQLSEGSRRFGDVSLRVVHGECARCEESVDLFFRVELLH